MLFNHSTSNCMKSLFVICPKSANVMSKQCLGVISISLFCQIMLFRVIHFSFIIHWLFHFLTWTIISPMFALIYTFLAFCLCKFSMQTSKQLFPHCCSNVIMLLYIAEIERVQSLMRTLAKTDFKSI